MTARTATASSSRPATVSCFLNSTSFGTVSSTSCETSSCMLRHGLALQRPQRLGLVHEIRGGQRVFLARRCRSARTASAPSRSAAFCKVPWRSISAVSYLPSTSRCTEAIRSSHFWPSDFTGIDGDRAGGAARRAAARAPATSRRARRRRAGGDGPCEFCVGERCRERVEIIRRPFRAAISSCGMPLSRAAQGDSSRIARPVHSFSSWL